jgi:hypothetical protein
MSVNKKKLVCSICGNVIEGYGNNPAPIKTKSVTDVCCDECNYTKVIPARLGILTNSKNK